VSQPGDGLGLSCEARAKIRAVEALLEQLDRDLPIELWVAREIDQAHPALPQALQDLVTADRRRHRCHACA